MTRDLLAVAHRAGNSLASLEGALAARADVVEADVHWHRGGLEVRHLKTMGPLPWLWDRWELADARAARLGLADLLLAAGEGVTFMLDLKGRHVSGGEAVAAHLWSYAPDRPVLVCSRYWPALRPFRAVPWVRTVRSARTRAELALLLRGLRHGVPCEGASVHLSLLDGETLARLHERLGLVLTWPVDDRAALRRVLELPDTGTLGVISRDPEVLAAVHAARG